MPISLGSLSWWGKGIKGPASFSPGQASELSDTRLGGTTEAQSSWVAWTGPSCSTSNGRKISGSPCGSPEM